MSEGTRSFRYRLEKAKPRTGAGGLTRGASVHEFPASIGIRRRLHAPRPRLDA